MAGAQLDVRAVTTGGQHRRVQVAPMHDGIGLPKRARNGASSGMCVIPALSSHPSAAAVDEDGAGASLLADTERIEGVEGIWAKLIPAPISPSSWACSNTITRKPLRESPNAVASPPMPPPAITIVLDAMVSARYCCVWQSGC